MLDLVKIGKKISCVVKMVSGRLYSCWNGLMRKIDTKKDGNTAKALSVLEKRFIDNGI